MVNYEFYKDKPKPKNHICAVALIVRDGKVLMGLREYIKGKPLWTFPGGRCDIDEAPEVTLHREVQEEIGISDLSIKRLIGEKEGVYKDAIPDMVFMYECSTQQEPKLMEPEKFLEWRWVGLNELPDNLIDSNDIKFLNLLQK